MNNNPIGVFDSGVGGLSVFKEITELLPDESVIYFADSNNCPYGEKSQDEIIKLSKQIVEFLISKSCKIIIVACNTATALAIDYLRKNYSLHFIGMEPAIKPAALSTKTGNIGVLATASTFKGNLYNTTKDKYTKAINVYTQVGKGLVELVEDDMINTDYAYNLVSKYIKPLVDSNVDKIVLGCTHYPFLSELISNIVGNSKVEIINPAPAIALQTNNVLKENKLNSYRNSYPKYEFYTTGNNVKLINSMIERMNISNFITSKV